MTAPSHPQSGSCLGYQEAVGRNWCLVKEITQVRPQPSRTSVDYACPTVADHIELAVTVVQVEPNTVGRLGRCAADLGDLELDAIRNIDPYPMLLAGRRAQDRPAGGFEKGRNRNTRGAPLDVHLEIDR